jgi:hypothetical protein
MSIEFHLPFSFTWQFKFVFACHFENVACFWPLAARYFEPCNGTRWREQVATPYVRSYMYSMSFRIPGNTNGHVGLFMWYKGFGVD